jgi:hypothetical protein
VSVPRNLRGPKAREFVECTLDRHGTIDVLDPDHAFPHAAVAAALHQLVYYKRPAFQELYLWFGKQASKNSFPLHITPPQVIQELAYLKVGLCSGRHSELDNYVDCYLVEWHDLHERCGNDYREREDHLRKIAYEFFGDPRLAGKRVELHHTGAHALVVGAYHGIVDLALQGHRRCVHSLSLPQGQRLDVPINHRGDLLALRALSDYFCINNRTVRWKRGRPMTTKERQDLEENYHVTPQTVTALFNATQFQDLDQGGESIWG